MSFDNLTKQLQTIFTNLRRKGKVSEADVQEAIKKIRFALLEADVSLAVVKEFIKKIRERSLGHEIIDTLNPTQQIIKIVDEELTSILGSNSEGLIKSSTPPTVIMIIGLQGTGKTTFTGKLANRLKKAAVNTRPIMIAADIYRPAAVDQLKILGNRINVPVFDMGINFSAVEIVQKGLELARKNRNDYVLIDTAGRLQIDTTLMTELCNIKKLSQPDEILLVVDSMMGQEAANVAKGFNRELDITGIVLTKSDGDTRGGAALSVRHVTGKPIKFMGTGEKIEDIEAFHPDRMSSRILGMGDILTFIEKASQEYNEKKANELVEKIRRERFDFNDFIEQLDQIQNMGPIENWIQMIPGISSIPGITDKIKVDPTDIARKRAIVSSMTPDEREDAVPLTPSRRRRIASGSGNTFISVNQFIKQFNDSKKIMNSMMNGNINNLFQKQMQSGMRIPDISALNVPASTSPFSKGMKGKMEQFAAKQAIKHINNKLQKARKKKRK